MPEYEIISNFTSERLACYQDNFNSPRPIMGRHNVATCNEGEYNNGSKCDE
jgi:hypothetical protein